MTKIKLFASLIVAAVCVGNMAVARADNMYYVVVPVEGKVANNIAVSLAGHQLPSAVVGQTYGAVDFKTLLTVTGDAAYTGYGVKWDVVDGNLPAGLTLSSSGVLSGTPVSAGTSTFRLRVTYKTKAGENAYQIVVVSGLSVLLAAGTAPQALVGQVYSYDLKPLLNVTGDNAYDGSGVTWTVVSSTLPDGLQLKTNGTIAGTPTAAGTGTVTARATYRGADGEQTFQVVTLDVKVSLADGSLPVANVDTPFNADLHNLVSVSGDESYDWSKVTWSVASGALPAGLSIGASGGVSGFIVGTPTESGTTSFSLRATYRGVSDEHAYQLVVSSTEDNVPNASGVGYGDGNGDGIVDSRQANVTSLPTVVAGNPYVTLAVDSADKLLDVTSKTVSGLPRNVKMPFGQLGFTIGNVAPGGTVQVSYYVPSTSGVSDYWLYNPDGGWTSVSTSVTTVGTKTKVTFNVSDGGPYDADGLVNGIIAVATH